MIEILLTLSVMVIGMWAMLDLHTRLQVSEFEAYQRTQALALLDDMANRIMANRKEAAAYVTDSVRGIGTLPCSNPAESSTLVAHDQAEWCQALRGSAVGRLDEAARIIAGRGCVEAVGGLLEEEYLVTVVWQGATPLAQPPATLSCGKDQYNQPADSSCADSDDRCRRYVSTLVHIASLSAG